jgi:hypothetical protein
MDRVFVYPGMLPQDTDLLTTNRNVLSALGLFAQDMLGTSALATGLACSPGTGLTVAVGAGRLYALQNVDNSAYGTLASDTTDQIVKQGINLTPTTLACAAPGTSGFSINYLIQAQYQDSDTPTAVLGYFNSTPPYTPPLNGPANSGTAQPMARRGIVALQAKAGTAAATGTQTTPAADSGWTGLYVVTVAHGASSIVSGNIALASGAPFITETLTQKISQATGDLRYLPQIGATAREIATGVTPVSYQYPPGHVFRQYTAAQITQTLTFSATPTLDCSAAINAATKCATGDVFFPDGIHYINAPCYIPTTASPNVRWVGASRTNTKIEPMANNIADALAINAMIINQQTNGKFSLYRMRLTTGDAPALQTAWLGFGLHADHPANWSSTVSYAAGSLVLSGGNTYVCILASTNNAPPNASFWVLCGTNAAGYTAANCDYIFSGSIEDCWIDDASNAPFFAGGLNNYLVANNTFEFKKGLFMITGGTADLHVVNNSVSNSYDWIVQSTMNKQGVNNGNIISVRGLHVYTHNRGVLFAMIGAWSVLLSDITLQAASGALGVGLASLVTTQYFQISNCNVQTDATLTSGPTATILTFQACTGIVSDCIFDGCDTGVLITGTGANRIHFENVEIRNTLTAAFKNNVGTPSGLIKASHCDWSDGQTNLIISTIAAAFDFYLDNCRIMNAGLGGVAGFRNITVATSGLVRATNCIIGQNNGSAAASYYLDCAGTGDCLLVDPTFIGTPPTAIQNPSATQLASIGRFVVPYSASMTFSAQYWDKFVITATNATAFTINAPTSPMLGKKISVMVRNSSGGALGAVTWNGVFKLSAWSQPANGNSRSIDFTYDGANWVQSGQTGVDIPN